MKAEFSLAHWKICLAMGKYGPTGIGKKAQRHQGEINDRFPEAKKSQSRFQSLAPALKNLSICVTAWMNSLSQQALSSPLLFMSHFRSFRLMAWCGGITML